MLARVVIGGERRFEVVCGENGFSRTSAAAQFAAVVPIRVMKSYHLKYDAHYRSLYEQGIQYWSDGPDHCRKNVERVTALLSRLIPNPEGRALVEIGCGEGHLALPIVELGFDYAGIDVSPAAIEKARGRTAGHRAAPRFEVAEAVAAEGSVFQREYDVVLDQACFHMLVVDADSRRYLANIHRMMHEKSLYLMLRQARDEDAYDGPIKSIVEYEEVFKRDLSQPNKWEAWNGEEWVPVQLPAFAVRPRRKESYIREVARAGFDIQEIHESSDGHGLDFVLRRGTTSTSS